MWTLSPDLSVTRGHVKHANRRPVESVAAMTGEEATTGPIRGSQSGSDRLTPCGWAFAHPARIDRRRAAQRGSGRPATERVWSRLSEALRLPCFRPEQGNSRTNIETGSTGPLRGSQRHSERSAEPRSARRDTERGGAGRTVRGSPRQSERVRQRLSGGHPSGRSCPIFWTVYDPVIHSRQLASTNRCG